MYGRTEQDGSCVDVCCMTLYIQCGVVWVGVYFVCGCEGCLGNLGDGGSSTTKDETFVVCSRDPVAIVF